MGATYKLPKEMRQKLAKPLGRLFDAAEVGSPVFSKAVDATPMVISVGDRVTETLGRLGRVPDVQIVDGRENRKERPPPDVPHTSTIRVRNPAGTITEEAIEGIIEAFGSKKPVRVIADGEEDLLAVPVVVFAPLSSGVFYGQPGEGIVLVRVTAASKARNKALLLKMGVTDLR